jgi:outer membrane receptor protein involved in Fe transport
MQKYFSKLALLLSLCLFQPAFSQTRGTIQGTIHDKETGEALPMVNVVVQGTYYGAASDPSGNFIIRNINPGIYTLMVSMIGYTQVQPTGVKVHAGQITVLSFKLSPTILALGQEVMVVGAKPLFDLEETSSRKMLSSSEIKNAVVEKLEDVVATQVGVVQMDQGIHIRGGRTYENALLLDGLSVQDPLSGTGFGLNVSTDAIEEMEVITGGFNAEYGQAMSGVVNIRTREGSRNFHGRLSLKRDYLGNFNADIPLVGTFSQQSRFSFLTDVVEANLQGPLRGDKVTFFCNFYMFLSNDYTRYAAKQLSSSIFYGKKFAPRQMNDWSGLMKITWRPNPAYKLAISANQSASINQNTRSLQTNLEYVEPGPGYPYEFQQNLDNFNTFTHLNNQLGVTWTHTLNTRTFYELRLSRYMAQLRSDLNGKHWSDYEEPFDIVTYPIEYFLPPDSNAIFVFPGDGFYDYGNSFTWHDHFVMDYTLKGDLTYHHNQRHKLKAGMEMTYREMQLIDIYAPWYGDLGLNNDIYQVFPNFGAAYLQDNIMFKGLIANLGIRFDYWFPGKYVEDAIDNPAVITISDETRRRFKSESYNFLGRSWKGRISPRIGISHPISDNQMLFFSYGHFSKLPRPQFVYAKLGALSSKSTFQKFGNPNLNPETTVAYELGIKHKFTENDVLTVSAYYKDIFDYVTTVSFRGQGRLAGRSFITYLNLDYSRARGLELEYKKRAGQYFSGSISGAYSIATGKSSNSDDALLVARGDLEEKPITENFLIWDRPWQVNSNLTLYIPEGKALRIWKVRIPEKWRLNLHFFAEAGKRYTPYYSIGTLANGRPEYQVDIDKPYSQVAENWKWVNVNFQKDFDLKKIKCTFFVEVMNLFNWKSSNLINPITGRAYKFGDPTPNSWNDPLYPDRQGPVEPFPFNPARYRTPRNTRFGFAITF